MTAPKTRRPLKGYPIETPFTDIAALREYFSESRIRCLRCGRRFKGLAGHLWKIHEMTVDDYREMYNIPWTYGLVCPDTSEIISQNSTRLVAEGKICTTNVDMKLLHKAERRHRVNLRDQICTENLAEVNKDCTGEETRRRKAAPKRGTLEYHEMMAKRPQCVSKKTKERLRTIWLGKRRNGERGKMID